MENHEKYRINSLNEDQLAAFRLLDNTSENYYVTGKAGTGKSYLLQTFVKNTKKRVAIIAPTGIASMY